jgi:peptidoglycan-associated lipoprotein
MKLMRTLLATVGVVALIAAAGCSKKPAPAPPVTAPATKSATAPAATTPTPPVTTPQTTSPARIELQDAFFDFDKSELKPEARQALTQDAELLMADPSVKVLIEGHCDERGTNEYNMALGDRRARSAMDFLVKYGVAAARIETISYGEERPIALGHDESAWWQNRRAHFVGRP